MRIVPIISVAIFALSLSCAGPSGDKSSAAAAVAERPVFSEEELDRARATYESLQVYEEHMKFFWSEYPDANNISEMIELIKQNTYSDTPLSLFDGWGNEFRAHSSKDGYEIRSAGSDDVFEDSLPGGVVDGLHRDIVLASGKFVQVPEPSLILPTPTPTPSTDTEKAKATMSSMQRIVTACGAYQIDFDEYPLAKSIEDLAPLVLRSAPNGRVLRVLFHDEWQRCRGLS